jgi:hypothetical protein
MNTYSKLIRFKNDKVQLKIIKENSKRLIITVTAQLTLLRTFCCNVYRYACAHPQLKPKHFNDHNYFYTRIFFYAPIIH